MADLGAHEGAPYPGAGTLRVHPQPEWLPQPPDDASSPGQNRFDDPSGRVPVRYTATRLVGCLYETMARFRPSPTAETTLQRVEGIDADDVDWAADDSRPIADWLDRQQVGPVRVLDTGAFTNIEEPDSSFTWTSILRCARPSRRWIPPVGWISALSASAACDLADP